MFKVKIMNFKGKAKLLDDIDLPEIGSLIGVGEDELHAFLDVETRGSGFDSAGRPKMLFEPHIFYRYVKHSLLNKAMKEGLAYRHWKPGAYPKDSYPRLEAAMKLDSEAALKSASWGLGQIMGFNYKLAGYSSVFDMVESMVDDEEDQLRASVEFIVSAGLDDELRAHDWAGFAKGYNGSAYKKNQYDRKLSNAYAKWSKIRDTPWKPSTSKR